MVRLKAINLFYGGDTYVPFSSQNGSIKRSNYAKGRERFWIFPFQNGSIKRFRKNPLASVNRLSFHSKVVRLKVRMNTLSVVMAELRFHSKMVRLEGDPDVQEYLKVNGGTLLDLILQAVKQYIAKG